MKLANNIFLKMISSLLAFILSGIVLFSTIYQWDRLPSKNNEVTVKDKPHRVCPLVQPLFSKESSKANLIDSLMEQSLSFPKVGSALCHLLYIYGLKTIPHNDFSSGMEIISILTDYELSEKYLGQSIQFQTRYGVRYKLPQKITLGGQDGESHRDIFLATYAELGLPITTPIRTATGTFTLRDLLKDSVAHFSLKQQEISWTAISYILYLPPQRQWCNRDEELFTFDDLASEILQRPLSEESCGGTHLLEAMTFLIRVDSETPILSKSIRKEVYQRLKESVSEAILSQADEGYWTSGLNQTNSKNIPSSTKLLMTGHIIEWMQYLPVELQPNDIVYKQAADWLISELSKNPLKNSNLCPWTHAICSVRNLVGNVDKLVVDDRSVLPAGL